MKARSSNNNDGGNSPWPNEERRKSFESGEASAPVDSSAAAVAASVKPADVFTDEKVAAEIHRLQNLPSGEIFKSIGGVLAAHHELLTVIAHVLPNHTRRLKQLEGESGVANLAAEYWRVKAQSGGIVRKLSSAWQWTCAIGRNFFTFR